MPVSTRSNSVSLLAAAKNLVALKRTRVVEETPVSTRSRRSGTTTKRPTRQCATYTPGMYAEYDE